jgi:uncharacterized protein (TIGR03435 family)
VIDNTGLTGAFNVSLRWSEQDGPSIFTAVQEQLGLRLEARRLPTATIVIDSAERPSEN